MLERKVVIVIGSVVMISLTALLMSGCAKEPPKDKDIVAYVNKDVIFKSDLKRNMALRADYDSTGEVASEIESDQLDAMIDRKLIVQYAMEKGLARDERFVTAIRNIWEHALIRDFMDYQRREFRDSLFATAEDIENYYNNMSYRVTFKIFKSRNKDAQEAAYSAYLKDKNTSSWQEFGPISYDEIESIALLDAFSMGEGEIRRFADDPNFYVIEVSKKEKVDLAPLDSLKSDIEKRVIGMKEKRLFDNWLKERRKIADIKINMGKI